ncbi:MAG: GNAT family N-acetyltransferase [bacterium]
MTLAIVPAEACDAVAITGVVNSAYRVEDFFKVGDRTNVREIADFLLTETFLIARDEDEVIVGAVRVAIDAERGHFGMLSVAPEAQGTGLGRRLVEAAEEFARGRACTLMDLEVASPRAELPPFYEKFGYTVTGTAEWPEEARSELKSPAHFIVMSKFLTQPA